ncbi:MAG: glycoside hydrolase family 9 protein [Chitinivibrionales bacterium]
MNKKIFSIKLVKRLLIIAAALHVFLVISVLGSGSENIRLNQIGFYQYGPKMAAVISQQAWRFSIKSIDLSTTYYAGDLEPPQFWPAANETAEIADFSDFTRKGTYVLDVAGVGTSYPFRIDASVNEDFVKGLIRGFYYQRASASLPAQYAGKWSRNEGHPDTRVVIHPSAASDPTLPNARKAGDIFPSPKGWYDAGDYGKYTVNAGITVYTLLALYEQFHGFFDTVALNIPPVSGLPDLLSEIKWELDWLLTMQDPSDGGAYHKLTSLNFCGYIMPDADDATRYFIGKGSAATFDLAAVCAVASRVYRKALPLYADSCLAVAKYAWSWGSAHPDVTFTNPPDVLTGEYGDWNLTDEMQWAAEELFLATGDTAYGAVARKPALGNAVPGWQYVSTLGTYSLAYVNKDSSAASAIVAQANALAAIVDSTPFHTVMYNQFYWGSNSVAANEGMVFIEAFLATKDVSYFEKAVHALDYLAGRNALGVCFVTGFGSKSPLHPSHRPSVADGITDPIPGLLVGGPNLGKNDTAACAITYPSAPAKCWVDQDCAYACNEVAINWNAPAAFLAGAIEAIYADTSYHVFRYKHDSIASAADSVIISGLAADRVTVSWTTGQAVSASIEYGLDSALASAKVLFSADTMHHAVTITGLAPAMKYYFRLLSADDLDSVTVGPLQTITTAASALLDGFSFDPSGLNVSPGVNLTISFTDRSGLTANVRFSKGGDPKVSVIPCNENNGAYTATIPGQNITAAGLLVSIALSNSIDSIVTPVYGLSPSAPVRMSDTLQYAKTYYMFSLPLLQTIPRPLDFFGAQLGDTSQWRYYGYNSLNGTYTTADTMQSGQGAWLYAGKNTTITVLAAAPKPDTLFSIPLSQGWNLIGSPFAFPVFWENSLVRYNGNVLRVFDNASQELVRRQWFHYVDTTGDRTNDGQYVSNRAVLLSDTTRLLPWNGYWVYAEKSGVELLLNPSPTLQPQPLAKRKLQPAMRWSVRLTAVSDGAVDNSTVIGESRDALDAYDKFDSPKPPQLSSDIVAGILHPSWPGGNTKLFSADIAHYSDQSIYEWQISLSAAPGKAGIKLSWETDGAVNGHLTLSDPVSGATADMSASNAYSMFFLPGEHGRLIKIHLLPFNGTALRALPAQWSLQQTAPNPFKASTKIRFSVPVSKTGGISPNAVVVSVFDMMGRRVRTLVSETKYPGNYSVVWNGTDDGNRRLRQGVYIVHLSADGFSGSVKTQLVD